MIDLEIEILGLVSHSGELLMKEIVAKMANVDRDTVKDCVMTMVQSGLVRMKEDSYEHDWAYRITGLGRERLGQSGQEHDVGR